MRTLALAIVLFVLGNLKLVRAAELEDDQAPLEKAIQQWIAEWDKPSFFARNAGSRELRNVGRAAFPALVAAAQSGTHETTARALALLKSSLHTGEASVQAAARKSLDQIAAGPNASPARSAQQILRDYDRPPQLARAQAFGMPNGFPGIAGRINTWTNRGTTTIEAFENNVKIKIQSDATGRIKVEITQKKQGLDVPSKFEAANVAELRTKHPEGHQAYQRYEPTLQQAKLVGARMRGMPGAPAVLPFPGIPNVPLQLGGARHQVLQNHEAQIEVLKRHIAQAPTPAMADSLNRSLQQIIESREQLQRELNRNR